MPDLSTKEGNKLEPEYIVVRQRAGPLTKVMVTDAYWYRRYGPGAAQKRCRPAFYRTEIDKAELKAALFGYDGVLYTFTFTDEFLPEEHAEVKRLWANYMIRLKRCIGFTPEYLYRIEHRHGDGRWHIHAFFRYRDCPSAVVASLWPWGHVDDEVWNRKRLLSKDPKTGKVCGYRALAMYFTKEQPEKLGWHAVQPSRGLSGTIPLPEVRASKSPRIWVPPGAVCLDHSRSEVPEMREWGMFGYQKYLAPEKRN